MVKSRILQDNRRQARISVNLKCRLKYYDKEYDAQMLDLSQGGTLLSATVLMSDEGINKWGRKVTVSLGSGGILNAPLTLSGTIKRNSIGISGVGKVVKLGIEFDDTPLILLRFISSLSKSAGTPDTETPD